MIKTIRVMLISDNKQKTKLFQYANAARFAYNWALGREKENYVKGGKFISDANLRKKFTKLKKTDGYLWLNDVSNNVPKAENMQYHHFIRTTLKFSLQTHT